MALRLMRSKSRSGAYCRPCRRCTLNGEGVPWTAAYIQSKGDPIADLHEDMAAEEKARATYEWLINLSDDPDLNDTLRFLRQREVVHFQRFGEALQIVQNYLDCKKVY